MANLAVINSVLSLSVTLDFAPLILAAVNSQLQVMNSGAQPLQYPIQTTLVGLSPSLFKHGFSDF